MKELSVKVLIKVDLAKNASDSFMILSKVFSDLSFLLKQE
jgi:hypothetical protein